MTTATARAVSPIAAVLFDRVGFSEPHPEQLVILGSDKRFILVAGGEQAGKSLIASKFLVLKYFEQLSEFPEHERFLYWLVAADYERTRAEFEYLVEDFTALFGAGTVKPSKRVDPGYINVTLPNERQPRLRIETKSAKDPRTIAMKAPHGIIGCEGSQLDLQTFERLQGRIAPKRGWLFLAGTFEESLGWYPQIYKGWKSGYGDSQSFSLPTWTNIHLYPGGRNDPEILRLEKESSDAYFMERIGGEPVPPAGLVFGEFRPDIHVKRHDWIVGEPVHVWIDPGYAGAYAVLAVQIVGDSVQVFDEIFEQGLVTEEMADIVKDRPWYRDLRFGVIDIAGRQHQAMQAPVEAWLKHTGIHMKSNTIRINDGTERLKGFLKPHPLTGYPKITIDPGCQGVLSEFGAVPNPHDGQTRAYRWQTDREGNIVGKTPEDKYNHGIKALIYGIVDRFGYARGLATQQIGVRRHTPKGRRPRRGARR